MWAVLLAGGAFVCGQPAPPDRWPLMQELQGTYYGDLLDSSRINVYGWAGNTFTAATQTHGTLLTGFAFLPNQYLLQQNWLRIDRPVNPASTEPDVGFRIDSILPGTDYRFTLAKGLFDGQLTANNGQPNLFGFDPVQFYADFRIPEAFAGLTVRVGRFYAPYGIDSIASVDNLLSSRSYTDFYDPFTLTGVLTTLKVNEAWTIRNGVVLGPDIFIDPAARATYVGTARWAPPGGPASLLLSVLLTPGSFNVAEQVNMERYVDLVWSYRLGPTRTCGGEALFGWQPGAPGIGLASWYGLQGYLRQALDARTNLVVRLEFFDDLQGQRTGFPGLYTALSVGINYSPFPALLIRPELRVDDNNQSRPFGGSSLLFQGLMNVVVRW